MGDKTGFLRDWVTIVQSYVVDICMSVCLVLLHTLYGFVGNIIVVRTRKKGTRARCSGRVVCIARKKLYSHVYFVCTHAKYMVSGDSTRECALLEYAECIPPWGVSTPISMLTGVAV